MENAAADRAGLGDGRVRCSHVLQDRGLAGAEAAWAPPPQPSPSEGGGGYSLGRGSELERALCGDAVAAGVLVGRWGGLADHDKLVVGGDGSIGVGRDDSLGFSAER